MIRQFASHPHGALHTGAVDGVHFQFQQAVIEQQNIPGLTIGGQGGIADTDLFGIAGVIRQGRVQGKGLPGAEHDGAVTEAANADFGSLQIGQNGHVLAALLGAAANLVGGIPVGLCRAVGKIQPEDVHARTDQCVEHGFRCRGGADGGNNLGAAKRVLRGARGHACLSINHFALAYHGDANER